MASKLKHEQMGGKAMFCTIPMLARILGEGFRGDPKWRPQDFIIGGIPPIVFEQGLLRRRRHVLLLGFVIPRTRATARHFGSVYTEVVSF